MKKDAVGLFLSSFLTFSLAARWSWSEGAVQLWGGLFLLQMTAVASGLSRCSGRPRFTALFVFLGGAVWGLWHGAPTLQRPVPVVRVSAGSGHTGGLIRVHHDGQLFLVGGAGRAGEEGRVRCPPEDRQPVHPFGRVCRFVGSRPRLAQDRDWVRGLVSGRRDLLGRSDLQSFRDSGLMHLLVISGFHVNLIAGLAGLVMRFPWWLLYALGRLAPVWWGRLCSIVDAAVIGVVWLWVQSIGWNPPCQRAFFFVVLGHTGRIFGREPPADRRDLYAAALQAVFFPRDLLSLSAALSWVACLFLSGYRPAAGLSWKRGQLRGLLVWYLTMQIRMILLCWLLFDRLTPAGLLSNFLLAPFFPMVFALALVLVVLPGDGIIQTTASGFIRLFRQSVALAAGLNDRILGGGIIRPPPGVALCLWVLIFLSILSSLRGRHPSGQTGSWSGKYGRKRRENSADRGRLPQGRRGTAGYL